MFDFQYFKSIKVNILPILSDLNECFPHADIKTLIRNLTANSSLN